MTSVKMGKNRSISSKTPPLNGSISGGNKLRRLREDRRLLQFDLDLDGIITQANYSKIERGLSAPSKEKLEDILGALGATFNQSQDILKSFGYLPPYPLPSEQETDAISARCQPILDELPLPAYLVDILTKLIAWNNLFANLIGNKNSILMQIKGKPLFKAQFASRLRLREFMDGMDAVLLDDAYMIRERLAPYREERWYRDFIAELCEEPAFQHYWDVSAALKPDEPTLVAFADRILHPVRFAMPDTDGAMLEFYSNPELLLDDNRFQMIYLIPADRFTLRQVERWHTEL